MNQKYEGLYQAGEIFNPDWLSVVDDARQLRFMDWMNTNSNPAWPTGRIVRRSIR